ncbi:MAG: hypothetical protein AAFP08_04735 [Bacteroidota bacterium]
MSYPEATGRKGISDRPGDAQSTKETVCAIELPDLVICSRSLVVRPLCRQLCGKNRSFVL